MSVSQMISSRGAKSNNFFLRPDIYTEMLAPSDNLGRERKRESGGKARGRVILRSHDISDPIL